MGELTISINDRPFQIACEDGDEPRVLRLAEDLAAHIRTIKEDVGEAGDARLLVLAGLMMCDELREVREELGRLKQDWQSASLTQTQTDNQVRQIEQSVSCALSEATKALNQLAASLHKDTQSEAG